MTENQKADIRHDTVTAMMDDARLAVRVIDPAEEAERIERMMAEADDRTREVLERYGGLTRSRLATAAIQDFASAVLPGLSAWDARSSCVGPSTWTASTSSFRGIAQP